MNPDNLRYFRRPESIILFLQTFFSLLGLRILLQTMKLPRLLKLIEPKRRIKADNNRIALIVKFSNFILHRIFRSPNPCILRSLILFRYLKMMGIDMKIAFGVKEEASRLRGHAWLIHKGRHFLETGDPSREYEVMFVYP